MRPRHVTTLLAGGVGGAKLAHGLARLGSDLTVVVNTADDFEQHGLAISPDLDTVMYTLAGMANRQTGWGVAGETFTVLEAIGRLGEDTWFRLGDQDLATHIVRTAQLGGGMALSEVTRQLAAQLGVRATLLPMSDQPVSTILDTPAGYLGFQEYFVGRQHQDDVTGVTLTGIDDASPAPGVLTALAEAEAVIVTPSNPFVSIGPILAVPGMRDALATTTARRIAVSPIIGGRAVKGPAAEMLRTMGHDVSALGIARIYAPLVDMLCIDERDSAHVPAIESLGVDVLVTNTVMHDDDDRERLAEELLTTVCGT